MWNQLLEKLGSLDPGVLKNAALMIAGRILMKRALKKVIVQGG